MKDCRTADHIFTLKTIIDTYRKRKKQNLYMCFVDFRKAFDTVWHTGLFHKLHKFGISGKFYEIIKNMYSKITLRVKTEDGLTPPLTSQIGVRQGDILSPLLFNIYVNDITDILTSPESDLVALNGSVIPCLMYADDIVLISSSRAGLQQQLDTLHKYCSQWHLDVNTTKTKCLVISGKTQNIQFTYGDNTIDQVTSFPYLGIVINTKGDFKDNAHRLSNKSLRALYKLNKSLSKTNIKAKEILHIYDHTVKPILLYGSEVTNIFNPIRKRISPFEDFTCTSNLEKSHKNIMRRILWLNNRTSLDALYSEFGRYPIYIEIVGRMLKYERRLISSDPSSLVHNAYSESKNLAELSNTSWVACVKYIKNVLNVRDSNSKFNSSGIRKAVLKMQDRFVTQWKIRLFNDQRRNKSEGNKLRTFRKFKNIFKFEPYINLISNTIDRANFCKFRISAHKLNIELGRHSGMALDRRLCNKCNRQEIEDELHAFMFCPAYDIHRQALFRFVSAQNINFKTLDAGQQFIWLMANEEYTILTKVTKFITHILSPASPGAG